MNETKVLELAKLMHDVYEISAKRVGWKTQDSCKVEFDNLPKNNKKVMLLVAEAVLDFFDNGFIINETLWIRERAFEKFYNSIKSWGEHCSYPTPEELTEMLHSINVKVSRQGKRRIT